MSFDKEAQRFRAQQFASDQLARGVQAPPPNPIQVNPFNIKPVVIAPVVSTPSPKAKKEKKKTYLEEAFTNEIGQVINPGVRIVAVTQGYNHSIGTRAGVYLGLKRDLRGNVSSVTVQLSYKKNCYNVNGVRCRYGAEGAEYGPVTVHKKVTLSRKRIFQIT